MKSGNLNFLEPSGPLQAWNVIALLSYLGKSVSVYMYVSQHEDRYVVITHSKT
jgi:hypothetical protein